MTRQERGASFSMRDQLLHEILDFAESRRPASDMDSWWEERAVAIEMVFGRFACLSISKRKFYGLKQVLEREGVAFSEAPGFCRICGERMFVAKPGVTTREQIFSFAESSGLFPVDEVAETGWIHPGMYCANGCMSVLWNIRSSP